MEGLLTLTWWLGSYNFASPPITCIFIGNVMSCCCSRPIRHISIRTTHAQKTIYLGNDDKHHWVPQVRLLPARLRPAGEGGDLLRGRQTPAAPAGGKEGGGGGAGGLDGSRPKVPGGPADAEGVLRRAGQGPEEEAVRDVQDGL